MPYNALEPRPETFDVLGRTRNAAAVPALAAGLLSPSMEVRARCVELLLARKEAAARQAIVSEWTRLDSATREQLASVKGGLEKACKEVLASGSHPHKQAVITAISDLDITAALPELVAMALESNNPLRDTAMAAVCELCDRWGQRARQGKDVPSVRAPMIETLHRAVYDFPTHHNFELIDAWLMLVCWEDASQRSLISDPMHPAFRAVLERFWHSDHKSVLQLLGGYIWRNSTPKSVLGIICERPESELPIMLAESLDENTLALVLRRLQELPPLASLAGLSTRANTSSSMVQRRLWLMLAANSPSLEKVLAGAVAFYESGTVEGRRTAAEIIRSCRRTDVETLVGSLQGADANPADNQSAGAHLNTILSWIGGESTMLDAAAREFFSEFTVTLLMDAASHWPPPLCRTLARIVSRAEPDAVQQLLKALENPSPKRRLLALQVIQMLDATAEISQRLLPLVHDSRVEVRVRAIDLLAALECAELFEVLPMLLDDPTTDVQDAARRALRRGDRGRRSPTAPSSVDVASSILTSWNLSS
ncbi:MAG: HEAT repeat domain-containing protein [Aureliella sp.]